MTNFMTRFIFLAFILIFGTISCSNNTSSSESDEVEVIKDGHQYDSLLAFQYGADDYGMKKYIFAFLKRGPNRDLAKEEADKLQRAHMDNINRMAEAGKLVMAGPFFGDGDLRGIYIFNVATLEEAEELTNSDPAIQAGSLKMELVEWYGSAAIVGLTDLHSKIAKKII